MSASVRYYGRISTYPLLGVSARSTVSPMAFCTRVRLWTIASRGRPFLPGLNRLNEITP